MSDQPRHDVGDVLAVIPARYGSSRFPGKPLVPISGIPMILRVAERVAEALPRGSVMVATDDERIASVVEEGGYGVRMTPSHCLTGTDRVWEAVKDLDSSLVLNIQGDEPLVDAKDIAAVVEAARAAPGHVVNAMCVLNDDSDVSSPNVPKVVVSPTGDLVYMSRAPVPATKSGLDGGPYYRQVCIYAFRRAHLSAFAGLGRRGDIEAREDIEILRFIELGVPVRMILVPGFSVAVDVPEDVARVEALLDS